MKSSQFICSVWLLTASLGDYADSKNAQKIADKYAAAATASNPSYTGLSAEEGKAFFNREVIQFKGDINNPGKPISCASCHTANPADKGKHIVTGKAIKPLSPAVNPKRFNDVKAVEKGFTKHCNEVVGSDCTPQEKGNYIAYLLTEKTPSPK